MSDSYLGVNAYKEATTTINFPVAAVDSSTRMIWSRPVEIYAIYIAGEATDAGSAACRLIQAATAADATPVQTSETVTFTTRDAASDTVSIYEITPMRVNPGQSVVFEVTVLTAAFIPRGGVLFRALPFQNKSGQLLQSGLATPLVDRSISELREYTAV